MKLFLFLLIAFVLSFSSSCKLMRKVEKSSSDSIVVKRETEKETKVDSSKSSKEKEYERITYIFPKDTNIINHHYHTTKPSVIIQERGVEKEQTQNYNFDEIIKQKLDSAMKKEETKSVDSKVRVGPSTIEWILIAGLGLLLIKNFGIINFLSPKK